ncbi:ACP S-malonyltransferase [Coxiella endosymbiont of Amblyomma americanum]|uniref:ACP S-malonyltransferase n=1 Tax=Coxiella endosymbiont of Amblyomma americanum TaxID=325775 RepID=UPI00058088F9|nr:ACP S-malonyltransferase [Coxiella endosymbiont of Amblyomma americanum]AJC50656.1 malonyl CoA-ACP transacylase [Coxiella endosymbiont of Amblyomma americanum]AUJ58984.1 malonyl CoA-acyl carrier protein transacylase [Coxiella-like endosymbiont of Amblyomma americanum]
MSQPFALIFPGQGSQYLGMLKELAKEQSIVEETFYEASSVLGYDLWLLTQKGPKEKLDQTQFTQPALLVAGVSVFRCWKVLGGPQPQMMAGHSLGEYTALVCAKAITFTDAVALVKNRGIYMQEAAPIGKGSMGVIIGLSKSQIEDICEESSKNLIVRPANLNSLIQTVISGDTLAVDRALALARVKGAKIAKHISVSVPSHSSLMQPAAERLAYDLAKVKVISPRIPVIHNVDVLEHQGTESIRSALVKQLVDPVRWVETIQKMTGRGIKLFGECGPNNKLAGLNSCIERHSKTFPLTATKLILSAIDQVKKAF